MDVVDEKRIADGLRELADEAGGLLVGREEFGSTLTRRRRARRRRVAALALGGVSVFAVVAMLAYSSVEGGTADPAERAAQGTQQPDYFRCGEPIPSGTSVGPVDGVSLSIDAVRKDRDTGEPRPPGASAGGPPVVTYRVDFVDHTAALDSSEVPPRILVLRDGVVVGGPLAADPEAFMRDSGNYLDPKVDAKLYGPPLRAWPVVESKRANWWLCGATDWEQVWNDAELYEVAVVMTPLGTAPRHSYNVPPNYSALTRTLIIARYPLSAVQ